MIYMKATDTNTAAIVKNSGHEGFLIGDIVQWTHEYKGRGVTAFGEVSNIMRKNMWVNLLGKQWKVNIQEATLIHRVEEKPETIDNE